MWLFKTDFSALNRIRKWLVCCLQSHVSDIAWTPDVRVSRSSLHKTGVLSSSASVQLAMSSNGGESRHAKSCRSDNTGLC